jgi:glucokinase
MTEHTSQYLAVDIGGGILPRLIQRTSFEPFLKAFKRPGPMSEFLNTIPINIIIKPDAALLGAARYGSMIFREN